MEKRLLKRLLELHYFSDKITDWSVDYFQGSSPQLYRLKMIASLFNALEIKVGYADFFQGKFLKEHNLPERDLLLSLLSAYGIKKIPLKKRDAFGCEEAQHIFKYLLEYRLYLNQIQNIGSDVYASSGFYRLPFLIFSKFDSSIKKESKILDALLCLFINPKNKQFTKKELIEKFDFPNVQLRDIDLDAM